MSYRALCACILTLLITVAPRQAWGQIAHGGTPREYMLKSAPEVPFIVMPRVDNRAMIARDTYSWDKQGPYKFGEKTMVDLGPDNSGVWTSLENGDRIWNLGIRSEGAFSLNLIFSEYQLLPGAMLFIFNEDKSEYIGGFDYRNNKAHCKLATVPVSGEAIIIEYYEPQSVRGMGLLKVGSVTHAYRDVYAKPKSLIKGFGAADPCTINIHCPQGDEWQDENRSVIMLMVNGTGFCSATLVNNTANDSTPYVLTADHCLGDGDGSNYVPLFNYESSVCENSYPRTDQSVSGTVIRARNEASDFALLEMSERPPASYNALYSGWTRSTLAPERYICIGHPSGDVKKWSEERPRGREDDYWWSVPKVNSGQTEYGSSGSGVWDQNGRLVGQLYGGSGWCDELNKKNYWGRFDRSWEGGGSDSTRLKDWLDPADTDTLYMDHFDPNASSEPRITFQLNLSEVEDLYEGGIVRLYLVEPDSVVTMADTSSDGVYVCTLDLDQGTELKYYFSYQIGPDPENDFVSESGLMPGDECVDEEGYRTLTVEARNQTLPAVYFASCLVSPELPEITFQVDLSEVTDMYRRGQVWVSFGNWDTWWVLRDDDEDGIYAASGLIEPGSEVKYFFSYQTGPSDITDYTIERPQLRGLECANAAGFRLLSVQEEDLVVPAVVYGTCRGGSTLVSDLTDEAPINLFFNALNDQVMISNASEVEQVEIFSITGQLLILIDAKRQESIRINANQLRKGVFVVRLRLGNKSIQGVKFLK